MRRILVVALACLVQAGCDNRSTPTAPAERILLGIGVVASKTDVNVGETIQLQAISTYSDGSQAPAAVTWAAIPNAVASISAIGALTGLKLGSVAVTARTSTHSAVSEFRIINENGLPARVDLSGAWAGEARVKSCERVTGPGSSPCRTGTLFRFGMALTQTNYDLASGMTLGTGVYAGTLNGWRDYIGNVHLTGTLAISGGGTAEVTKWETRVSSPWSEMSGEFEVVERFTNDFGSQVIRVTYELVNVAR